MSIARTLFGEEHLLFRDALDRFIRLEAVPNYQRYEEQGYVDRDLWLKAGAAGFICSLRPEEEYGGAGADKVYSVVLFEQAARHAVQNLLGWALHSEIVAPYLLHYGSDYLQERYLPQMATGDLIGAIVMTEPTAGFDLQGIATTALRAGECYVLNGSKTFMKELIARQLP